VCPWRNTSLQHLQAVCPAEWDVEGACRRQTAADSHPPIAPRGTSVAARTEFILRTPAGTAASKLKVRTAPAAGNASGTTKLTAAADPDAIQGNTLPGCGSRIIFGSASSGAAAASNLPRHPACGPGGIITIGSTGGTRWQSTAPTTRTHQRLPRFPAADGLDAITETPLWEAQRLKTRCALNNRDSLLTSLPAPGGPARTGTGEGHCRGTGNPG
jgi:hypothetical protein